MCVCASVRARSSMAVLVRHMRQGSIRLFWWNEPRGWGDPMELQIVEKPRGGLLPNKWLLLIYWGLLQPSRFTYALCPSSHVSASESPKILDVCLCPPPLTPSVTLLPLASSFRNIQLNPE